MICGGFGVRLSADEGRRWAKVDVASVVRGKLKRDGRQSKRPRWFGVEGRKLHLGLDLLLCVGTTPLRSWGDGRWEMGGLCKAGS